MPTQHKRINMIVEDANLYSIIQKDARVEERSLSSHCVFIVKAYYAARRKEAELFVTPQLHEAKKQEAPFFETPQPQPEHASKIRENLGRDKM